MTYLVIYLIITFGTAIACTLMIYTPVYRELKLKSINNLMVSYKYTGYFAIFVTAIIATPVIFPILFNTQARETFRLNLVNSLLS
jgi:hypothetical protein